MTPPPVLQTDLVLVGGGHAHALVLRRLAMRALPPGLRITLVSPASHTPYSGMLPGLIAGHYTFEQTHIDLLRLCSWAGVRFVRAEVTGLDATGQRLLFADRPDLEYDLLSLDIGSQPELEVVPGAAEFAVPVKPVAQLWARWQSFLQRSNSEHQRLAIVGAGAGGVELTLAMAHALQSRPVTISLFSAAAELLDGYNAGARRAAEQALIKAGVKYQCGVAVAELQADLLRLEDGSAHAVDTVFWCTRAAAAAWVADSGLATDSRGFLLVDDTLRSISDPRVFAAGDIASLQNHPRPKAGVHAVRQAPVLGHNLLESVRFAGQAPALRRHRPQQRFLSLVSLGSRRATADRGPLTLSGDWVWAWKDHIDSRFMRRFAELPARAAMPPASATTTQMPCGGCAAKLGSDPLRSALSALRNRFPSYALPEDDAAEDVACFETTGPVLQSIDSLRALVDDPFVMGEIAAQHALSDLYAVGAEPFSALAHVVLPYARPSLQRRDLEQILAGALSVLAGADCPLRGGHSLQGPEIQVGFVVNGRLPAGEMLRHKRKGRVGDQLILTRPLGSGVIFAANMQQRADGRDVVAVIEQMRRGNAQASRIAAEHAVQAATDVTGFGLLGHLREMLPDGVGAQLSLGAIPFYNGALTLAEAGVRSTLWADNFAAARAALEAQEGGAALELLCDPQTGGGLLLAVPAQGAQDCLQALKDSGHNAAIIGELQASTEQRIRIAA